ncbi:PAS domain S-box protein [Kallotenue papyrolyticum]|uniref:PAS domain S-box protein n=1 Tax=Kallotenue papyrolyticum TaxID=1325125 RepID=UPI00046F3295|nr:PAS domain S-box protein [Kallotenue papyrolyticum]
MADAAVGRAAAYASFDALFQRLPDAMAILDPDGMILCLNAAWQYTFAKEALEQAGLAPGASFLTCARRLFDLDEATRRELEVAIHNGVAHQQNAFELMQCQHNYDGLTTWVALSVLAYPLDAERGVLIHLRDITALRAIEAEVRQREEHFRQLAENIQEVFWIVDARTHTLIYVSPAYEQIWGRSCASVYADPASFMEAIHAEDRARVQAAVARQAEGTYDEEYRVVRPDGSVRWIRDRAFPVRDARGAVQRIVGIAEDITDRRLAEEALRRSALQEEVIRAQAAVLAELSTPLFPAGSGIVVMPLIGTVDAQRAQRALETLLHGVQQHRAQLAIIDITGVPTVNTQVADALIRAAQAVRLLGAEVVLTGIRPEVAQTLVSLGIGLDGIMTYHSLQDGIAFAMARQRAARANHAAA